MKHKINLINSLIVIIGLPLILICYLLPFEFFVDVHEVTYHDMCVGDRDQAVTADRDVRFKDAYFGTVLGELFLYDGLVKQETVIKRKIEFAYQVSEEPVTYQIRWSEPITDVGQYGASDLVTITPLIFKKTAFFSEDDQMFKVKDCN